MNLHVRVMSIGALAKAAGVSTPTVRYYEEIGLLPQAGRSASGQRIYRESDVPRLTFIKRCRDFGFSIDDVRVLAGLSVSPDKDCSGVRDVAREHLTQVQVRLAELRALEVSLKGFVDACDTACAGGPGRDCRIFEEIAAPVALAGCCP